MRILFAYIDQNEAEDIKLHMDGLFESMVVEYMQVDTNDGQSFYASMKNLIDSTPELVVNYILDDEHDYFRSWISNYCNQELIPVIEYRSNPRQYAFTINMHCKGKDAAVFIKSVHDGFAHIEHHVASNLHLIDNFTKKDRIMNKIFKDNVHWVFDFENYFDNMYMINQHISAKMTPENNNDEFKKKTGAYIIGNTILNSVFRFPGLIMHEKALCAYFGVSYYDADKLMEIFSDAAYDGPFKDTGNYFWKRGVDSIFNNIESNFKDSSVDDLYKDNYTGRDRYILEQKFGYNFRRHDCKACKGEHGGQFCPYTETIMCRTNSDCPSWAAGTPLLPRGADMITTVHKKIARMIG